MDITKCTGTLRNAFPVSIGIELMKDFKCPLKDKCKRFVANDAGIKQSWFVGLPLDVVKNECEYFFCHDIANDKLFQMWYKVDSETVGQFTGLTDKNGKEIYEGDIVETDNNFNLIKRIEIKYCVETLSFWPTNFVGSISEYYIIGNIHENPELLEVKK